MEPTHLFDKWEAWGYPLYEMPVTRHPSNRSRKSAPLYRVAATLHHNDRARTMMAPLNDPGPFRAIARVDAKLERVGAVAGLVYHPLEDARGFNRAPVEPMSPRERLAARRFNDGIISSTWACLGRRAT